MLLHPEIRSEAQALFENSPLGASMMRADERAWGWALDDLLGLLAEFHDQPVHKLRPMLRRVVIEHVYLDHAGDSFADGNQTTSLEGHLDHIVLVLEKVRLHAVSRGQWSAQSTPPLMCG